VLVTMARELETQPADMSPAERTAHERAVLRLTAPSAPLPDFSGFHPSFTDGQGRPTREGDVRRAFYLSYNDSYCEYLLPDEVEQRVQAGEQVVSTTYVTPYPPGFPVLVPGQVFSPQILAFMRSLDTPEIHGYRPDLGYNLGGEFGVRDFLDRLAARNRLFEDFGIVECLPDALPRRRDVELAGHFHRFNPHPACGECAARLGRLQSPFPRRAVQAPQRGTSPSVWNKLAPAAVGTGVR